MMQLDAGLKEQSEAVGGVNVVQVNQKTDEGEQSRSPRFFQLAGNPDIVRRVSDDAAIEVLGRL